MERDTKAVDKISYWRGLSASDCDNRKKKPREKIITPEMKTKHDKLEEDKFRMNNPVDVDPFE